MTNYKRWTNDETQFLVDNYSRLLPNEISKNINKTDHQIRQKAAYLHLTDINNRGRNLKIHSHNKEYFRELNYENCYWAGFIAADGNIHKKYARLSITVHINDTQHLLNFKENLDFTGDIYIPKERNKVSINIHGSKELVFDLKEKFNIGVAKSTTLEPPLNLKYDYKIAFIKGLIDGDGHIGLREDGKIRFSFCGTSGMVFWVRDLFNDLVPASNKRIAKPYQRDKNKNFFSYSMSGERVTKILKKLSEVETPMLDRKWCHMLQ